MTILDDLRSKEHLDLRSFLLEFWERKLVIIVLLALLGITSARIAFNVELISLAKKIDWLEVLIIAVLLCGIFLLWFFTRRPVKTSRNKIGIVIGITAENKKERQRLRSDLILSLQREISGGQHFEVLALSEYHAGKITSKETAGKYHRSTRGHFIIYGCCKIRDHHGTQHYVLDLEASVAHSPIPDKISMELSSEMRSLIPPQQLFPVSEELDGFTITKEMIGSAARYIVGLASLLSGDLITAFNLHAGLWEEVKREGATAQPLSNSHAFLGAKLPTRLALEGVALASFFYRSKQNQYLEKMKRCLDTVEEVDPRNYGAYLLRGIYYFLAERDIEKAKQQIQKSRNERDAAWQFSDAFLAAYDGDLERAHKIYKRAFMGNVKESIPLDVETFIRDVLDQEPSKIQLWYCLGMINYFSKGDPQLAKEDFERFVDEANKIGQFNRSIEFAQKYISEIERTAKEAVHMGA